MKKYLISLTAVIILLITATGTILADSNSPVQIKPDANKVAKTISAAAPVPQQNDQTAKIQQENERLKTENIVLEKAVKAYEKSTTDLRWGIGIITGLIGVILTLVTIFAAYMIFKDRQEYERAVVRAETAAAKTEKCEEEARKTVAGIDKIVDDKLDDKLKEIDKKANEAIAKIGEKAESERKTSQKEAEKERKIGELWAEGLRALSEGRFEDSCKSYQEITSIKDIAEVWCNWGTALLGMAKKKAGAEADRLFEDSYAKYKKAIDLKPDDYEAWYNWGNALSDQAEKKEDPEAERLFLDSYVKFQKAIDLKPDDHEAWYNWGTTLSEHATRKEGYEVDRLFAEAYAKFQKAVEIKPYMYLAWVNWGAALAEQAKKKEDVDADRLFADSYVKFRKAVEIKPDKHNAWDSWGGALSYQAQKKKGDEKKELLQEAKEKLLKSEQIKKGEGSYNLACMAAIERNEGECKKWLKTAEEAGTLPTRKKAMADDDLKIYREEEWFKSLKWKE